MIDKAPFISIIFFFLFVIPVLCFGFSVESIDLNGGLLWLGNAEEEGAPSPLLSHWGGALQMSFSPLFMLSPELSVFGTQYQRITGGTKAVPTEIEKADQVYFLSVLLSIRTGLRFRITENLAAGALIIPSFIFRIPLFGWDNAADDPAYRDSMTAYLYDQGRFFYPAVGAFVDWAFSRRFGFSVTVRTLFPLFHAWDGEQVPFHDQMMVTATVGIKVYLGEGDSDGAENDAVGAEESDGAENDATGSEESGS